MTPEQLHTTMTRMHARAVADMADVGAAARRAGDDLATIEKVVQACTDHRFPREHIAIVSALVDPSKSARDAAADAHKAAADRVAAASRAEAMTASHVALQAAGAAGTFYQPKGAAMPEGTGEPTSPQGRHYTPEQVDQLRERLTGLLGDLTEARLEAFMAALGLNLNDPRVQDAWNASINQDADAVHAAHDQVQNYVADLAGLPEFDEEPAVEEPAAAPEPQGSSVNDLAHEFGAQPHEVATFGDLGDPPWDTPLDPDTEAMVREAWAAHPDPETGTPSGAPAAEPDLVAEAIERVPPGSTWEDPQTGDRVRVQTNNGQWATVNDLSGVLANPNNIVRDLAGEQTHMDLGHLGTRFRRVDGAPVLTSPDSVAVRTDLARCTVAFEQVARNPDDVDQWRTVHLAAKAAAARAEEARSRGQIVPSTDETKAAYEKLRRSSHNDPMVADSLQHLQLDPTDVNEWQMLARTAEMRYIDAVQRRTR